jgi:curli biogenesis system outer membrane secretion channel CsgG
MISRIAIVLVFAFASMCAEAQKRKVAVLDFGYATVRSSVQAYFGTDQDIGKGISDLLIKQLLIGAEYRIIERSALDAIMKEQDFSNTRRADPATAAKIGGLLGVDAVIIGDITAFGNDDKHYGAGGGLASWGRFAGLGDLGLNKNKTVVEISARIVDVNSAEVLAAVDGHGESKKTGMGVGAAGPIEKALAVGRFR